MKKGSYYNYVCTSEADEQSKNSKEFQTCFEENLNFFPNFPDVELISELSYENYERKACTAKLVFLPFESLNTKNEKNSLIFSYTNEEITFEKKQIRLIRKVAESLDENHALVLRRNANGIYYFNGIIKEAEIDKSLSDYYFISINGHSDWSARCKNFNLFDFKNGNYCKCDKNDEDFNMQSKCVEDYFKECSFEIDFTEFNSILEAIKRQNHGTSFVVFKDAAQAQIETRRLCSAQRGFAAEKPLECKKLIECVPMFTKVDGGLLLDSNLTCYAYGCIYDGIVSEPFKGSLAHGSRFNSTALYVQNINSAPSNKKKSNIDVKSTTCCVGVVFSDDGGVKIAEIK